jgi:hypothetical protein
LSKARNTGQNDVGLDITQLVIAHAEAFLDISTKVFDNHIAFQNKAAQNLPASGRFQIQAETTLVAVHILLIGAAPLSRDRSTIVPGRRFHPDDPRAPI